MSENTLVNGGDATATDAATDVGNQATATRTYTQEEFDAHMARMKASLTKKLLKPYEDLGDPEELRNLRSEAERRAQEQQVKRGEFDKVIQDLAAKKDAEIQKRDAIIREYKINTPLVSAAARYQAVNADQVRSLLSNNLRLNSDGDVEVVDDKGSVRYSDSGTPLAVDDLVREFLDSNPHFRLATPATTLTKSNLSAPSNGAVDISKLDMKNPEHRKIYAEARKKGLIK